MPAAAIIQIPIEKIMPNPRQPRRRFKPGSIQEMSDSLTALGQQTPAKVRPLTADEKVSNPGFEYMVIGGHRRLGGAKLAGFKTLDCYVLNITPAETHRAALMDNDSEEMDWWDWDLAIEEEDKTNPGHTQRELAGQLGVSQGKVYKALKLARVLNPSAREKIDRNLDEALTASDELGPGTGVNPSEGVNLESSRFKPGAKYEITEYVLLALADLGDSSLVERALKVVLDRHLTEQKAKKLVVWAQKGNPPEDFGSKEPIDAPEDPYAAYWPTLAPGIKVKYKGGETYHVQMTLQGRHAAWNALSAASNTLKGMANPTPGATPTPSPLPQVSIPKSSFSSGFRWSHLGSSGVSWIAGNILWQKAKQVSGHILNRFFPRWFTRIFNKTSAGVQRMGVKNQGWAAVITLFLVLMVGSFLIGTAKRILTRMAYHMLYSRQVAPSQGAEGNRGTPMGSAYLLPGPQVGGQALVVSSQGAEGNRGTQMGSAPNNAPVTVYQAVTQVLMVPSRPAASRAVNQPAQAAPQKPTAKAAQVKTAAITQAPPPQAKASNLGNQLVNLASNGNSTSAKTQGDSLGKGIENAAGGAASQAVSTLATDGVNALAKKLIPGL